ncbi:MAG TPA: TadE/TadG family type IV pilus assembly protein [Pirellulaceae bacterium]|jgi:Flp pilus assembly protein TadG|nr:TadE/TadG family type IV pilus assembly protein [Pirellulaceae bacterium]
MSLSRSRIRTTRRAVTRRGATTVEMAFVVPVVFMLTFGALEFARVSMVRNTVEDALFEGARQSVLPGATSAKITTKVNAVLATTGVKQAAVTIDPATITTKTQKVTVRIRVPMSQNSWLPIYMTGNVYIDKSCTLSRERTFAG